ncbi:hypothetical protein MIB92_11465 [Aestuariirhabdus sp. Z084]|uniref:hypothetical protein n=1 Tax=Aestuariirhabdus haliotis TaxID=2918751 RepID=UPI00201B372B|nr:hypothetical protein [Aestuariirhabdus haliotis]MCL6416272.1 hypothetical protein [Aestuariirhabdus haliotis]MCL6420268.1 hypothetical protein [Aestuariirhabdus haliotis]
MKEEEYLSQLKQQRHMFEWCLLNIGVYSQDEIESASKRLFSYKPESDEYRWLVFHDDAWHWAMLEIKGEGYWREYPNLKDESLEYKQEWERYESQNT